MVNQKVIVFQESFLRIIKNTDYYVGLLTLSFVCGSKPANNINKSDKLPLQGSGFLVSFHVVFIECFFPFLQYQSTFPIFNCSYKTKAIANKLQNMWPAINSRIRIIIPSTGFVDDTFKTSILIAQNFTQKSLLNSKLATTTTTTTPSHPSPVCASRHQPPSKLGMGGGGLVHCRERKMVMEKGGNIGRVDSKQFEREYENIISTNNLGEKISRTSVSNLFLWGRIFFLGHVEQSVERRIHQLMIMIRDYQSGKS